MGNLVQRERAEFPPLLTETQIFALWTINDVRELSKRFQNQIHGFSIVEAQFETIIAFKPSVAEHVPLEILFSILDNDHDGRIDGLELIGGLALCCNATFEDKARFCFELFDFNLNSLLNYKEIIMMMMSAVCGMNLLTGGSEELEPSIEVFEKLASDAITRADKDGDQQISYEEFIFWARSSRDLMAGLETLSRISLDAKLDIQSDDSAPETDDGSEREIDPTESIAQFTDKLKKVNSKDKKEDTMSAPKSGDQALALVPWLGQIQEPTNYKPRKGDDLGPETNLELVWAFGVRSKGVNFVRYLFHAETSERFIVYTTAAVCVIASISSMTQTFFLGHSEEITCLAVHPNQRIVATGDKKSNIYVWTLDKNKKPVSIINIRGIVKCGIKSISFSPKGDRIATIGLDSDFTVSFYSITTGEMISSGKGMSSPNVVYDMAYNPNGTEIVLAGKNQVKFFVGIHSNKRALESKLGRIGNEGKRQAFYSAAYMKDEAIIGCASGEIYRFKDYQCIAMIQAHGVKLSIMSLFVNAESSTLISGDIDGVTKFWDFSLKEIGTPIDLSQDLDGDGKADLQFTDPSVISLQQFGDNVLIGVKSCDIIEATLPSKPSGHPSLRSVAKGHCRGELWGLAVHPTRDEFVTVGDDKTVRIWSIRSREQINFREMPESARSVAYNPSGSTICIGMVDGSVALMEANSSMLRVFSTWKHSAKMINDVKFSSNGLILAIASADSNIYLYKSDDGETFRRNAVCKGHSAAVTHIDFSANSQFLQSNGNDYSILYWDMSGNQIKQSSSMRDTVWASFTCVFGWPVQGIWPKGCDYTDVNACMALPDIGDIVAGDDFGRVNLYRYPAVKQDSIHQSYVGHSSHVTCVRYTWNKRHVVSIGGDDKAILLWRHDMEHTESDGEMGPGYESSSSAASSSNEANTEFRPFAPNVSHRSIEQEAANLGWSMQDMKDFLSRKMTNGKKASTAANVMEPSHGDQSSAPVPQWRSSVMEPSKWKAPTGSTDVDLTLKWVHGHRSKDCRNNVFYSAEGSIVYNVAKLAVVYHKPSGKQNFLHGPHNDEVISIAIHPAGQIFATAEAGRKSNIVVWNSKDMGVISRLEGVHEIGTSLLAFNSSGDILASIGLDSQNSLSIHNWVKNIQILKTPTCKDRIYCCCFFANDSIDISSSAGQDKASIVASRDVLITGGSKYLKFWWWQGQNVQSQSAIWGSDKDIRKEIFLSVASTSSDICVTGSSIGNLTIWKDFKNVFSTKQYSVNSKDMLSPPIASSFLRQEASGNSPFADNQHGNPHRSAIQALFAIKGSVDELDTADLSNLNNQLSQNYKSSCRYISGDQNGNVCIWRMMTTKEDQLPKLVLLKLFNVSNLNAKLRNYSIKSICERNGLIVIGNSASEIFEVNEDQIPLLDYSLSTNITVQMPKTLSFNLVSSGHASGEVWGLATHPFLPIFFTVGDDSTVRCWSLTNQKLLSFANLPDKARAIDVRVDGKEIAISLNRGDILILKTVAFLNPDNKATYASSVDPTLRMRDVTSSLGPLDETATDQNTATATMGKVLHIPSKSDNKSAHWAHVMKYSFEVSEGLSFLAVGSHDSFAYLFKITPSADGKLMDTYIYVGSHSHSSFVTHIDFGVALKPLQTYDVNQRKIVDNSLLNTIVRLPAISEEEKSGDGYGRSITVNDICIQSTAGGGELRFWTPTDCKAVPTVSSIKDAWWATFTCPYGWPVQGIWDADQSPNDIVAVARSHTYEQVPVVASVDNVGRVRLFNYPSVQSGAPDKCYRGHSSKITNIAFSFDDSYCITVGATDQCVFVWESDIQSEIRERSVYIGSEDVAEADIRVEVEDEDDGDCKAEYKKFVPSQGDEAGAVKPWKGAIRDPSDWKDSPEIGTLPDVTLELKYVYGYRGWDCRNNLSFADSKSEVVYHIAGVGIVLNTQERKQILNTDHDDDILSLAVHPQGHTVATGEIGKFPKIVIWDANTGTTIRVISGGHKKGVTHLAFSSDGSMLISIGMDEDRIVIVYNATTGAVLGKGKAGKGVDIYTLAVCSNNNYVTGGKNHIKFWTLPAIGSTGGELSCKSGIYNDKGVTARTICSCAYLGLDAVSGMNDGSLVLWKERTNTKFVKAHSGAVTSMTTVGNGGSNAADGRETSPQVVSGGKDGFVHIWDNQLNKIWSMNLNESTPPSAGSCVQALASRENRLLIGTKAGEIYEVGILGAPETVRHVEGHFSERAEVWGLAVHPKAQRFVTCGDDMTVRLWDSKLMRQISAVSVGVGCRAVAFHPDGSQIAVALRDGNLQVLSDDLQRVLAKVTVTPSWSQTMTFSPDGHLLALGAHDNLVYLLETKSFSCKAKCKGHHSFISGLDFSADSKFLQSVSGDYELLFWDAKTGKQVTTVAAVRDVVWSTTQCTLGWAVQGIFPPASDGTDVNTVDRSPDGKYLATGDDFRQVKIFRYPACKENAKSKSYKGHSEHVMSVRFSKVGSYVFSVGGLDKAILQYEIKK